MGLLLTSWVDADMEMLNFLDIDFFEEDIPQRSNLVYASVRKTGQVVVKATVR